jgi:hypothetical protein
MKAVLPWLVQCALCAGQRVFCPVVAAIVSQVQNIVSSLYTASWAGSHARLPVSKCVFLG